MARKNGGEQAGCCKKRVNFNFLVKCSLEFGSSSWSAHAWPSTGDAEECIWNGKLYKWSAEAWAWEEMPTPEVKVEEPNNDKVPAKMRSSAHVVEPIIFPIGKAAATSQSSAGSGKISKVLQPNIIPISLTSAPSQPDIPGDASSARLAPVEQPSPEHLAPGMPKAAGQPPMPTAEVSRPHALNLKEDEGVFQNFLYRLTPEGDKWIRQRPLSAEEILQVVDVPRPNKKSKTDEGALPLHQLDVYTKTLQEWQEKNFPDCPELVQAIMECLEKKKLR